ncbi:MAG: hypothetical protein L3J96_05845, partial [Thermoplasmata archaeon]|nr:hypothetical protein [Thermoplasmata archaeon]
MARAARWLGCGAILLVLCLSSTSLGAGPHPSSTRGLTGLSTDLISVANGAVAHPLASNASIALTVTLLSRDPVGLSAFDSAVINPASPAYRQFLTQPEFVGRFAPAVSALQSVETYFLARGAHDISVTPDRIGLSFSLSEGQASVALGTPFVTWVDAGGTVFYSATKAPSLPSGISSLVAAISGLSGAHATKRLFSLGVQVAAHGARTHPIGQFVNDTASGSSWYYGSDLTQVYRSNDLFPPGPTTNASFGTGRAVATILMSGYNDSLNLDRPPFDPTAVAQYFNDTFPSTWPHPTVVGVPVTMGGLTPPLPGPYVGANDTSLNEAENSLDLEMAGSMAP